MAVYAIGDVQGCFTELEQLLKKIRFNSNSDQLWFVGDLVNRGPQSLETVQFVQSLGNAVKCVLGNHDIHLIACYSGAQTCKPSSSLNQILEHSDADEIIHWFRTIPLLHHDSSLDWTMVHAGMLPQWDLSLAQNCAKEVEKKLQAKGYQEFIANVYGEIPNQWDDNLQGADRWRVIINAFTRLRLCDLDGNMDFAFKGPLGEQDEHLLAWFDVPRQSENLNIVFGHWSALGLKQTHNLLGLDTGCLWGSFLTAARLDCDIPEIHSIECKAKRKIK